MNDRDMDNSFDLFGGAIPENEHRVSFIGLNSFEDYAAHIREDAHKAVEAGITLNQNTVERAGRIVKLAFDFAERSGVVVGVKVTHNEGTLFDSSVCVDCEVAAFLSLHSGFDSWQMMMAEASDFFWASIIKEDAPEMLNEENIDDCSFIRFTFGLVG